jgi:hypothetical protein
MCFLKKVTLIELQVNLIENDALKTGGGLLRKNLCLKIHSVFNFVYRCCKPVYCICSIHYFFLYLEEYSKYRGVFHLKVSGHNFINIFYYAQLYLLCCLN